MCVLQNGCPPEGRTEFCGVLRYFVIYQKILRWKKCQQVNTKIFGHECTPLNMYVMHLLTNFPKFRLLPLCDNVVAENSCSGSRLFLFCIGFPSCIKNFTLEKRWPFFMLVKIWKLSISEYFVLWYWNIFTCGCPQVTFSHRKGETMGDYDWNAAQFGTRKSRK